MMQIDTSVAADRRSVLKWSTAIAGSAAAGIATAQGQPSGMAPRPEADVSGRAEAVGPFRKGMFSYMLAHEQFPVPEIVELGALASRSGFQVLATSDHLQPWQANQAHSGQAWVTMGAMGSQIHSWMGTAVTCPTFRYNPAVVAEAFASLSLLYPGRVYLGVGSGEALNEEAATGEWPKWQERWDRLIEAIGIIRALWAGGEVAMKGKYFDVNAKLYNPPARPIPLLTAANGKKSMRLAGIHGDGLISDVASWRKWKSEWQDGARSAGKNPDDMPVMIETYAVVGDQAEAQKAAELWRFGVKAWKNLYNIRSPEEIEQKANAETSIKDVLADWAVGTDPAVHIKAARDLFDSGVTIANIHSGQEDQKKVIAFYGEHVLPKFRQPA